MKRLSHARLYGPLAAALCGVLGLYLLGALWFAGTEGVWSPDSGARLVQVESILQHPPAWWVSYPGEAWDPERDNSPLAFYEYRHQGRAYVFYSFLFALLTAPLFHAFGYFGLAVLPALGGIATLAATYALARQLRLRSPLAPALITALATPVALYAMIFWDHTLLTAFATLAVCLTLRGGETGRGRCWFAAGCAIGAGLWFHEVLVPYVPALIAGAWWLRRRHPWLRNSGLLVLGVLTFAVPLALFNERVYGTPLGPHLASNRLHSPGAIAAFLLNPAEWGAGALYPLIGWGNSNPPFTWDLNAWLANPGEVFEREVRVSLWLGLPLLIWLVVALSGWWRRSTALLLLALAGVAGTGIWVLRHGEMSHSLFHTCPLLVLAFCAPLRHRTEDEGAETPDRLHLQAVAVITAAYGLMTLVKPALGGTEWGARLLLTTVPSLAILTWAAVETWIPRANIEEPMRHPEGRPALLAAVVLLVLSLALQVHGMRVSYDGHAGNRTLGQQIRALPDDVVVTSVWWAPLNATGAFYRKPMLFAGDPRHPAPQLLEHLSRSGVRSFTLVGHSAWDLFDFTAPAGYLPVPGSARTTVYDLWFVRYTRVAVPGAAPDVPPPGVLPVDPGGAQ